MAAPLTSAPARRHRRGHWLLLTGGSTLVLVALLCLFLPAEPVVRQPPVIAAASVLPATTPGRLDIRVSGETLTPGDWLSLTLEDQTRPTQRFILPTFGNLQSLAIRGRYAYLANGFGGLAVADLVDPRKPRIVSSLQLPGQAWDVAVTGDIACVAAWMGGLHLIDIHDPREPQLLATVPLPGLAMNVFADGTLAYVGTFRHGLQIIDLSHPNQPRLAGTLEVPGGKVNQVAKFGPFLYLAGGKAGLLVADVTDPARPRLVASLPNPSPVIAVWVRGDRCLVADNGGELSLYSLAGARAPRLVGSLAQSGKMSLPLSLDVVGDQAYLGGVGGRMLQVDFRTPARPAVHAEIVLPGPIGHVKAHGGLFYLALGKLGLGVVDSAELAPPVVSSWSHGNIFDFALTDEGHYLATRYGGLVIADPGRPGEELQLGSIATPPSIGQLVVHRNRVFQTGSFGGLFMIDVTNPRLPRLGWSLPGLTARPLAVAGESLLVGSADGKLVVFDLRNLDQPRQIAELSLPANPSGIRVEGDRAYLACGLKGLAIVDLADPADPRLLGTFRLPWPLGDLPGSRATEVIVIDRLAYLAYGNQGLQLVDVTQPEQPKHLGRIGNLNHPVGLATAGKRLYVADSLTGVHIFDLQDPQRPVEVAMAPISRKILSVAVRDGLIYLATEHEGMLTLPEPTLGRAEGLAGGELVGEVATPTVAGTYTLGVFGPGGFAALPAAFRLPAPEAGAPGDGDQKRQVAPAQNWRPSSKASAADPR